MVIDLKRLRMGGRLGVFKYRQKEKDLPLSSDCCLPSKMLALERTVLH